MPRRKKQVTGNNKASWPQIPYKALVRNHGKRHNKGQTPPCFFNLKRDFLVCFLMTFAFVMIPFRKKLSTQWAQKLCHCSPLYARKSMEVATAKHGMVGCGLVGADRGDNNSITHCQILPSIPTPLICAEVSAEDLWADDIWLCRCNVTTLIYIAALSSKQYFSTTKEVDMRSKE